MHAHVAGRRHITSRLIIGIILLFLSSIIMAAMQTGYMYNRTVDENLATPTKAYSEETGPPFTLCISSDYWLILLLQLS